MPSKQTHSVYLSDFLSLFSNPSNSSKPSKQIENAQITDKRMLHIIRNRGLDQKK